MTGTDGITLMALIFVAITVLYIIGEEFAA